MIVKQASLDDKSLETNKAQARFDEAMKIAQQQYADITTGNTRSIDRLRMMLARQMNFRCETDANYMHYHDPIKDMSANLTKWLKTNGWKLVSSSQSLTKNPISLVHSSSDNDNDEFFDEFDELFNPTDNLLALYFNAELEALMQFSHTARSFEPIIHADQSSIGESIIAELTKEFPPNERKPTPNDNLVDVGFWHYDQHYGAQCKIQALAVPEFEEIKHNYSPEVRKRLNALMDYEPDKAGIILWSGIPGTGKTTALRSLARAWKKRAILNLIVDPEVLFNNPSYMQSLLTDNSKGTESIVLILEDAGELVAKEAKKQIGQGLARLLNMTDGLLGQGRKLIILITTNEEQGALNDAITRPGRGIQNLDFTALSKDGIIQWCEHMNIDVPDECDGTIAMLYEHARVKKSHL